jgi:hypothetical protein
MAKVSGPPHLPAQFAPLSGARGHPASERRTSSKVDKDDAALIERVGESHSKADSNLFASS